MRGFLALSAALALVAASLVGSAAPAQAVSSERLAGADRYATSVAISHSASSGTTVFLANGQKFPDALAAGPVVAAERGHLLLTRPDALPDVVAQRIAELAPNEIVLVGSEASISADVAARASAINGARITRIGGANRVETSLLLLERLQASGTVSTVWVASGHTFPDALVAASVAGRDRAAIILDHHGKSAASSEVWLDSVEPYVQGRAVRIAGGAPSVSDTDAQGLLARGATSVDRYAGANRYDTARIINDAFAPSTNDGRMLLATGANFPDALGGAVLASLNGYPMFLAPASCSAPIQAMLRAEADERGVGRVIGLGNRSTVSETSLRLGMCPQDLRSAIAQTYGTFSSQTFRGTQSTVVDLGRSIRFGVIETDFAAGSANTVLALDVNRAVISNPVLYSGTGLLAPDDGTSSTRYLEINARGSWTIELRDLTTAPLLQEDEQSTVGGVFLYDGPEAGFEISHHGTGWFEVRELTGAQAPEQLLWNCCERYRKSTAIHEGPTIIQVIAFSSWSLNLW